MEHYAGIDVSLEESSLCIVDATGKVLREVKVASEPEELIRYFNELDLPVSRIGLEAGPLSQWLQAGLVASGRDAVLLEDRARKGDALGYDGEDGPKRCTRDRPAAADGWYRPVHAKSVPCKDSRALLVGRKLLQGKLLDVELNIRQTLRGYGLKVGEVSRGRFEMPIRELIAGHVTLETVIGSMLAARTASWNESTKLHREMLDPARRQDLPEIDEHTRRRRSGCPDISLGGG